RADAVTPYFADTSFARFHLECFWWRHDGHPFSFGCSNSTRDIDICQCFPTELLKSKRQPSDRRRMFRKPTSSISGCANVHRGMYACSSGSSSSFMTATWSLRAKLVKKKNRTYKAHLHCCAGHRAAFHGPAGPCRVSGGRAVVQGWSGKDVPS